MFLYALIALGGALGSVARYWLSGVIGAHFGETFPWGTFWVNVTGCLLIGFLATFTSPDGRWLASGETRGFLIYGICGGYTTFSSFSLQALNLLRDGDWLRAGGYVVGSVVVCLVGVWLGHILATFFNQPLKG